MKTKRAMCDLREKTQQKPKPKYPKPYPSTWILMANGWDIGSNFCLFICFHYRRMKHLEGITNSMLGGHISMLFPLGLRACLHLHKWRHWLGDWTADFLWKCSDQSRIKLHYSCPLLLQSPASLVVTAWPDLGYTFSLFLKKYTLNICSDDIYLLAWRICIWGETF